MKIRVFFSITFLCFSLLSVRAQEDKPIPTSTATPTPTASPTPTATPQTATAVTTNDAISKINEAEYNKSKQETDKRIRDLTDKIVGFEKKLVDSKTTDEKLTALTGKVESLEKLDGLRYEQQIVRDKLQYEAGADVLDRILNSTTKLDFTLDFTNSIGSFQDSTNPIKNTSFTTEINSLRGNALEQKNQALPDLVAPLLANPYISTAWSIGSMLVSRLQNNPQKSEKFKNLICIVDTSTKTNADMSIMQGELAAISKRVKNFRTRNEALFSSYTLAVNKEMTVKQYRNELEGIQATTKIYFAAFKPSENRLELKETPSSLKNIRYHIGLVQSSLNEFDSIIKDMEDFLVNFGAILEKHSNIENCSGSDSRKIINDLKSKVEKNQESFRDAFTKDIPPRLRSILLGNN